MQQAMYAVSPWGERRADLRAAYHTANLMCANNNQDVPDDEFREMVKSLSVYLKCDGQDDGEETADLMALSRMKREGE